MKRSTVQDAMFPGCPVRNVLARICDKWALLVIYILDRSGKESMRFMELKQQMPDISQNADNDTPYTGRGRICNKNNILGDTAPSGIRSYGKGKIIAAHP